MLQSQLLKQRTAVLIATLTLLGVTAPAINLLTGKHSQSVLAQSADEQIASRVYQQVNPAVVTVKVGNGHGSGFVVSQDGLIITNAHVVADAPSVVTVVFSDGREVPADVIGFGKGGLDLAALRVYHQKNLTAIPLGSTDSFKVGYHVFAIGTPLDPKLQNTFTQGQISRIDQKGGYIQHTANINHGNSGGPLLNSQGEVIGVNTKTKLDYVVDGEGNPIGVTSTTGVNFAISVDRIRSFISAVAQGQVSPVSTLAEQHKTPLPTEISLNGQVIQGKLEEGDKQLDGKYVKVYIFQGRKSQQVTLEMNSQDINPYLMLLQQTTDDNKPHYQKIAENDDIGPGNFNSRIVTTLPEDGVYIVLATSHAPQETGSYTFRAATTP